MSAADAAFMRVALALGRAALAEREVPIGAVFVARGRVLAYAHNATNRTFDATRHAEMVALDALAAGGGSGGATTTDGADAADGALRALRARLADATVYVTVEPCIMCAAALRTAGVARVVFGAANDKFGGAGTVLDVFGDAGGGGGGGARAVAVEGGLGADAAVALLRRFYARTNPHAPTSHARGGGGGGGGDDEGSDGDAAGAVAGAIIEAEGIAADAH